MSAQRPALGIALTVAAAASFATMDATTRYLGPFLAVLLLLWSRYAVHLLVMAGWMLADRRLSFRTRHPRFQFMRGLLLLGSSSFAFTGLQYMPVAEFTAMVMLTPVLVTLLAAWRLGERVSPLRWVLVWGGFVGALIVIRPGSGLFGLAVLFPIGTAAANAGFQVLTTRMSADESPQATNFYSGLTGVTILTTVLLLSPVDIHGTLSQARPAHLALMLMLGTLGTGGHLLLIMALGMARTATLMPFLYTQLGFSALVGWLVFRATPDTWGWIGMLVIAVCGAASAWLNMRRPVSIVEADTIAE